MVFPKYVFLMARARRENLMLSQRQWGHERYGAAAGCWGTTQLTAQRSAWKHLGNGSDMEDSFPSSLARAWGERERSLIKKGQSREGEALCQYLDYPRETDETWKRGANFWSRKNERSHPGPGTRGSELVGWSEADRRLERPRPTLMPDTALNRLKEQHGGARLDLLGFLRLYDTYFWPLSQQTSVSLQKTCGW